MNSAQKRLVDTYFRKRKLANNQSSFYRFKKHEMDYGLTNKIIVYNDLNTELIAPILMKNPELVDEFSFEKIRDINTQEVMELIMTHPELVNKLSHEHLQGGHIPIIIANRPELLKYFNIERGFNDQDISTILQYQPQLIDKFDLSILTGYSIYKVLRYQPELIDRFDLSKMSMKWITALLEYQPHLWKYFKDRQ